MRDVIAASPMGARVGLSTARVAGHQALVTVAPKAWRPGGSSRVQRIRSAEWTDHVQATLFETDRVVLEGGDDEQRAVLEAMLASSRQERDGVTSWDHSLLAPDILRRHETGVEGPATLAPTSTADVLRLFERVRTLRGDGEDLIGHEMASPLHRPLLYRRLLDQVAGLRHSTRPGYRTVTQARAAVRGRVAPASLVAFEQGRASKVVCTYSELTISTHLLEVIATALEWIADGRAPRSPLESEFSDVRLRHDAVTTRRMLDGVQAREPLDALRVGRRLVLPRLEQAWGQALHLSLLVLAEREVAPAQVGAEAADAIEMSVSTASLWERIVTAALKHAGFEAVYPEHQQPPGMTEDPWVPFPLAVQSLAPARAGRTRPDNVAVSLADILVVDAKYKSMGGSPARDDQYQMFAYSHLVRDVLSVPHPRDVSAAVLVYPSLNLTRRWSRGRDGSSEPVTLYSVGVPFPQPDDLVGPAWSRYLRRSGEILVQELSGLARLAESG